MRRRRAEYKSHAIKRLGSTRALRRTVTTRRRHHSSSYRSDKCAAVAADDVPVILQNDDRLDHPAGLRHRLSW